MLTVRIKYTNGQELVRTFPDRVAADFFCWADGDHCLGYETLPLEPRKPKNEHTDLRGQTGRRQI